MERHLRRPCHCVAQRQRAVRGQLGHQPVGDRAKAFVLFRLRRHLDIAVDASLITAIFGAVIGMAVIAIHNRTLLGFDGQLILGPNETALDPKAAVGRDADERAGPRHLVGVISQRSLVERQIGTLTGRLDLGIPAEKPEKDLFSLPIPPAPPAGRDATACPAP